MSKQLKVDIENLIKNLNAAVLVKHSKTIILSTSDYNFEWAIEEYLELLESLKEEVDYEVGVIKRFRRKIQG